MKTKIFHTFKYWMLLIFPALSVLFCRVLQIAQGEKNEEIVIGIMFGLLLDLIYSVCLLWIEKNK